MFVSAQNSYDEILMPNVMVLGGGDFSRCLGHEAHMDGISALIKGTPQNFLLPSAT